MPGVSKTDLCWWISRGLLIVSLLYGLASACNAGARATECSGASSLEGQTLLAQPAGIQPAAGDLPAAGHPVQPA